MRTGLYIHVPFCLRKCGYCAFYSVVGEALDEEKYLAALAHELSGLPAGFCPVSIYMGGGTPTALSEKGFSRMLTLVQKFGCSVGEACRVEWTCEINPGTLTRGKAEAMRLVGVNRASLGVQSFNTDVLTTLDRLHSGEEAQQSFIELREQGFENINIDLIFGVPGMNSEILSEDLQRVLELNPDHISYYGLSFEAGTPITRMRDCGMMQELPDDLQRHQYDLVRTTLKNAGYDQYEISNFARPGSECQHNLLYWRGEEYLGCGPAAHSHWHGTRYANPANLADYLAGAPHVFEETLDPVARATESLILGLRLLSGVSLREFREKTGEDYRALRGAEIDFLCGEDMLIEENGCLRLTERALFVSDAVFSELV